MIATAASTWVGTAFAVVIQLQPPLVPQQAGASPNQLWVVALAICVVLLPIAPLWLLVLIYFKRPAGAVNHAQDNCWKFGLYYFNPQDAAWIVPARFGVGATLNFGRSLAWILVLMSAAGLSLRWFAISPAQNSEAERSVQSRFAVAALQLRAGDSDASARLLYIARHSDDPAVWSSVAYVLADNHVRPDGARNWAEKAVNSQEGNSQTRLATTNGVGWEAMRRLAGSWSNLGFVCSWRSDFDCAQRYVAAAWALDPLPAYGTQLEAIIKTAPTPQDGQILASVKLQSGVPVRQVLNISVPGRESGTAYFDVLSSQKAPTKTLWAGGDRNLSGAADLVGRTLDFPWPDDSGKESVRIRERLTCAPAQSACELIALSPEEALKMLAHVLNRSAGLQIKFR